MLILETGETRRRRVFFRGRSSGRVRALDFIVIRLRLVVVEYDVNKKVTVNLQRSKGSRKTTLGDLQRDQSKVQLSKSPSFIVN
jgi:hypothetical protein